MSVDVLFNELNDARSHWGDLYDLLRRGGYDLAAPRAAIDDVTVDTMHRNILLAFETLSSIRPDSESDVAWALVSIRLNEIRPFINTFRKQVQVPLNHIRSLQRENLSIRDANNNFTLQFFEGEANIGANDMSSNFQAAYKAIVGVLGVVSLLLPFCKAKAVGDLSQRAEAMANLVSEVESYRSEAQKLAKGTAAANDKANVNGNSIQEVLANVQAMQSSVQATQQQVEKENASVAALVAQIKTTGTNADALEQQIASYRSKFEAFQTQLDERLWQFKEFEGNLPQVEKAHVAREAEIDRLTAKAESMIKGATTAGLSKSLEDTREVYTERMYYAAGGFIVAILLLAVSALPLAAHLLPGLFGDWVKIAPIAGDAKDSAATIIGKIVLLLPATWLTIFFSKTFSEFFHLEREYAHKAALAKSVEGFKKEAAGNNGRSLW